MFIHFCWTRRKYTYPRKYTYIIWITHWMKRKKEENVLRIEWNLMFVWGPIQCQYWLPWTDHVRIEEKQDQNCHIFGQRNKPLKTVNRWFSFYRPNMNSVSHKNVFLILWNTQDFEFGCRLNSCLFAQNFAPYEI